MVVFGYTPDFFSVPPNEMLGFAQCSCIWLCPMAFGGWRFFSFDEPDEVLDIRYIIVE